MNLKDLEKQVSTQIIQMMEDDGLKWTKRWASADPARNAQTGHIYRGSNVLTTSIAMVVNKWTTSHFLTFHQAKELGGTVMKGSKGTPIIFFATYVKDDVSGTAEEKRYRFCKIKTVFNIDQIEGLDHTKLISPAPRPHDAPARVRVARYENYLDATGIPIMTAPSAFYSSKSDTVAIPLIEDFLQTDEASAETLYYSTLFHEFIHATGPATRMGRDCFIGYHKSIAIRAEEELIAEIGSAMLGQHLGLQSEPMKDNAAYVKGWIARLKNDPGAIFSAASQASKAIQWLDACQPHTQERTAA